MPILLKMIYTDLRGNVLKNIGPEELYLPCVHSSDKITFKTVADILEDELEEYNWSGVEAVNLHWEVISSRVC